MTATHNKRAKTEKTDPTGEISRRGLLIGGSAVAAGAFILGSTTTANAATAAPVPFTPRTFYPSQQRAYSFLDGRMDEYGSGTQLRLPRSYAGGYFATLPVDFVSSFAYDDSLIIQAYLGRGLPQDIQRATILGDALLYLQANDPLADGRTRASYQPDNFPVATPPRQLDIGSPASYTGNQAWVGMAFARLYAATGKSRYLSGALQLGNWIQTNAFDGTRAPFGYTGGRDADNNALTYKATEHNIDTGAFFTQLATITRDPLWKTRAATAFSFVAAMHEPSDGHLWTGTNPDGTTTNYYPVPEDVQSWAYLATLDSRYSPSLTWVAQNLSATDGIYTGVSFSNADTSKVWFEGTSHFALALRNRNARGDAAYVNTLFSSIQKAQLNEANGDGEGIVAASSDGLDTGFGDTYYASLHTGATAWYLLALTGTNPFRLTGKGLIR